MKKVIVVDTNVLVGALLSGGGRNRSVLRACFSEAAVPLIGETLFNEYEDVFNRLEVFEKCPLDLRERVELFEAFLSICEWTKVYYSWRPNLPDEGDNHLIELGLAGNASSIVTNNIKDFRRAELNFPSLAIETPNEFLTSISWQR